MKIPNINASSVGVRIILTLLDEGEPLPLSPFAGTLEFIFQKPDGTTRFAKTAEVLNVPGDDGSLFYETEAATFTELGHWRVRPHVSRDGTHDYLGEWSEFDVVA